MTALTENETRCHSPAVSPDGSRFAFVSDLSGLESIYVMSMDGDDVRRVATLSRKPRWLNATTLVFESMRPGRSGLYRLVLPRQGENRQNQGRSGEGQQAEPRSNLLFTRSGSCTVSPDERQLCVATDAETNAMTSPSAARTAVTDRNGVNTSTTPRLYLLAADGSGARVVPATEGARSPSFAPDGSAIVYDAPMDAESISGNDTSPRDASPSAANIARTLWFVPMLRVTPTALLLDVRRAGNRGMAGQSESMTPAGAGASGEVLEIVGTAFADGDSAPQVRLEWGEGSEPSRWNPLPMRRTPAHQTVLATWRVPSNARGEWTLRLTVVDADGDRAESTLPVTLPLAAPAPLTPPLFADLPTSPPDSPPARSGVPAERP
jgi:hypothetical protein